MHLTLETERTRMRPFTTDDAEESFSWFGDAEVMEYAFGADATMGDTADRIDRYIDHQNRWGFSKWIVLDRETDSPIGDAGFFQMPEGRGVELGYRLARSKWGRGLATEVAQRWIEMAGDFLDVPVLFAYAQDENTGSFRVMEKVGFVFSQTAIVYGAEVRLHELPLKCAKVEAKR
ncbi:MAG: GNAT family N-acetyltransferase [Verrucomicrobiota bacterium]